MVCELRNVLFLKQCCGKKGLNEQFCFIWCKWNWSWSIFLCCRGVGNENARQVYLIIWISRFFSPKSLARVVKFKFLNGKIKPKEFSIVASNVFFPFVYFADQLPTKYIFGTNVITDAVICLVLVSHFMIQDKLNNEFINQNHRFNFFFALLKDSTRWLWNATNKNCNNGLHTHSIQESTWISLVSASEWGKRSRLLIMSGMLTHRLLTKVLFLVQCSANNSCHELETKSSFYIHTKSEPKCCWAVFTLAGCHNVILSQCSVSDLWSWLLTH